MAGCDEGATALAGDVADIREVGFEIELVMMGALVGRP
jgi:hypothetical protein